MNSLSKNYKSCGNCQYWAGPRTIDPSYNWVFVEGNIEGNCMHPRGNRIAKWKAITSFCPLYQRLSAYK